MVMPEFQTRLQKAIVLIASILRFERNAQKQSYFGNGESYGITLAKLVLFSKFQNGRTLHAPRTVPYQACMPLQLFWMERS